MTPSFAFYLPTSPPPLSQHPFQSPYSLPAEGSVENAHSLACDCGYGVACVEHTNIRRTSSILQKKKKNFPSQNSSILKRCCRLMLCAMLSLAASFCSVSGGVGIFSFPGAVTELLPFVCGSRGVAGGSEKASVCVYVVLYERNIVIVVVIAIISHFRRKTKTKRSNKHNRDQTIKPKNEPGEKTKKETA